MSSVQDLEYHLEKSFVTGLRAVFMEEDIFRYTPDDMTTEVIITSAYPDLDIDFKVPQIVLTDTSFALNQTSLSNNFESDIIETDQNGRNVVVGKRYATVVPYSATISCFAQEHVIAKDLANRVFNMIGFGARDLFNNYFNLNISNVAKGGTGLQKTKPNNTYISNISITGNIHWIGEKRPLRAKYLNNIELMMKTAFNKSDYEEPYNKNDYEPICSISSNSKKNK